MLSIITECSISLLDGDLVKVYIGPDRELFQLPESLLCHHSHFFKAAFRGGFNEAHDRSLDMKETTVGSFELLLQWMITGVFDNFHPRVYGLSERAGDKIEGMTCTCIQDDLGGRRGCSFHFCIANPGRFIGLVLLADSLLMPKVRNKAIEKRVAATRIHRTNLPATIAWRLQRSHPSHKLAPCLTLLRQSDATSVTVRGADYDLQDPSLWAACEEEFWMKYGHNAKGMGYYETTYQQQ